MDPQDQFSSLAIFGKGLILEVKENLIHISQRAEEALHDLELAREILAFSQNHTLTSSDDRTSNLSV